MILVVLIVAHQNLLAKGFCSEDVTCHFVLIFELCHHNNNFE